MDPFDPKKNYWDKEKPTMKFVGSFTKTVLGTPIKGLATSEGRSDLFWLGGQDSKNCENFMKEDELSLGSVGYLTFGHQNKFGSFVPSIADRDSGTEKVTQFDRSCDQKHRIICVEEKIGEMKEIDKLNVWKKGEQVIPFSCSSDDTPNHLCQIQEISCPIGTEASGVKALCDMESSNISVKDFDNLPWNILKLKKISGSASLASGFCEIGSARLDSDKSVESDGIIKLNPLGFGLDHPELAACTNRNCSMKVALKCEPISKPSSISDFKWIKDLDEKPIQIKENQPFELSVLTTPPFKNELISYQWYQNNIELTDATNQKLLVVMKNSSEGTYQVKAIRSIFNTKTNEWQKYDEIFSKKVKVNILFGNQKTSNDPYSIPFGCTGNTNKGCQEKLPLCTEGFKISKIKVACNLEWGSVSDEVMNQLEWNTLKVVRASDIQSEGKCRIAGYTINRDKTLIDIQKIHIDSSFECHEHDNYSGGDCNIRGQIECTKAAKSK